MIILYKLNSFQRFIKSFYKLFFEKIFGILETHEHIIFHLFNRLKIASDEYEVNNNLQEIFKFCT
jgi:hypothetical protein